MKTLSARMLKRLTTVCCKIVLDEGRFNCYNMVNLQGICPVIR